jgi:hypothetical protein
VNKKIKAGLAAIVLLCTTLVATLAATPAQAYTSGWVCQSHANWATCVSPTWTKQADGTGVRLTAIDIWTSAGCSSLESTAYDPAQVMLAHPTSDVNWGLWNYSGGCRMTRYPGLDGQDSGYMQVKFALHVRDNFAPDWKVYIGIMIKPDGGWYTVYNTGAPA